MVFKLILVENTITYGNQDKVNVSMKKRPECTVLRHNIDDIKHEVLKLQQENPNVNVVFVGV